MSPTNRQRPVIPMPSATNGGGAVAIDPDGLVADAIGLEALGRLVDGICRTIRSSAVLGDFTTTTARDLDDLIERFEDAARLARDRAQLADSHILDLGSNQPWEQDRLNLWSDLAAHDPDLLTGAIALEVVLDVIHDLGIDPRRITWGDLEDALAEADDPAVVASLTYFLGSPDLRAEFSVLADAQAGDLLLVGDLERRVERIEVIRNSLPAVIAANDQGRETVTLSNGEEISLELINVEIINSRALADDPAAALDFLASTPHADETLDVLPLVRIDGAALDDLFDAAIRGGDPDDLRHLQWVIDHLPESRDATRAYLIRDLYGRLGMVLDALLAELGLTWSMVAVMAVDEVIPGIAGDIRSFGIPIIAVLREILANGNLAIFSAVSPHLVELAIALDDGELTTDEMTSILNGFEDGEGELQFGFHLLMGAMTTDDPERAKFLLANSTTFITMHEQRILQPHFDSLDADFFNAVSFGFTGTIDLFKGWLNLDFSPQGGRSIDEIITDDGRVTLPTGEVMSLGDGAQPIYGPFEGFDLLTNGNPGPIFDLGMAAFDTGVDFADVDIASSGFEQVGVSRDAGDWHANLDEEGRPNDWTRLEERMYPAAVIALNASFGGAPASSMLRD